MSELSKGQRVKRFGMSVGQYIGTVTSEAAHGVAETTHYPAIKALLNEAGNELTPKVRAIINPRGTGVGIPDGELWTASMMPKPGKEALDLFSPKEKIPDRGGLEVKGLDADLDALKDTDQFTKYLGRYRQMLLANLRECELTSSCRAHVVGKADVPRDADAFLDIAHASQRVETANVVTGS